MSALAQYFLQRGDTVCGYDLTPSAVTDMLIRKGADIHFEGDTSKIPEQLDFVVVTPAVPKDFVEYQYLVGKGVPMYKRSQVLGHITDELRTLAVAGTHGKTTTTSMIAHPAQKEETGGAKEYKFCPECGTKNNANAKFCIECGKKMLDDNACPNCGKKLRQGAKFCSECGAKIK